MTPDIPIYNKCILNEPGAEAYNEAPAAGFSTSPEWIDYLDSVCGCVQTHSLNVAEVIRDGEKHEDTDALICFQPGIRIGVRTADCVPIVFYAPDINGIGVAHAGWRGTLGGIAGNVIDCLTGRGADPACIKVSFGASISAENYEVSQALADKFAEAGLKECVSYPGGVGRRPHLDLQHANIIQILLKGIKQSNIKISTDCTFSSTLDNSPIYRSYRRDPENAGRNITWIKLNKQPLK